MAFKAKVLKLKNNKSQIGHYMCEKVFKVSDTNFLLFKKINVDAQYSILTYIEDLINGSFQVGNTFLLGYFKDEEICFDNAQKVLKSSYLIHKISGNQSNMRIHHNLSDKELSKIFKKVKY